MSLLRGVEVKKVASCQEASGGVGIERRSICQMTRVNNWLRTRW